VQKAIYSDKQKILQKLLRKARTDAGLTQEQLGERLGEPQSLISDYERGERRLDLIELNQICDAIGIGLDELVKRYLSV
jgi:transcriptional regulator with XRE-family HTH domain